MVTLGQTNSGCIIEGGLLTQVQTHAMETWDPLTWLYYRGWPANTGPNTCYRDFGAHSPGCIIEGGLLTQVQTHAMETLGPINLAVL